MTKYILNSGGQRKYPEKAKVFFAEYSKNYAQMSPRDVVPTFELAMPESFAEQVKRSDAILIQGGDDYLLQYWLKQFNLPDLWQGKTIAGGSAGYDELKNYGDKSLPIHALEEGDFIVINQ